MAFKALLTIFRGFRSGFLDNFVYNFYGFSDNFVYIFYGFFDNFVYNFYGFLDDFLWLCWQFFTAFFVLLSMQYKFCSAVQKSDYLF